MNGPFETLHPIVGAWCRTHLSPPTPVQLAAVPLGLAGRSTLICSPTGTGKTLAAFLPVMSRLAELRDRDELFPRPYALYISPLRALGYDVEHNLRRPLREMGLLERPNSERARMRRGRLRERFVRTGVRTGDTPPEERRLMLARPPHVVITTPESLALMLAMPSHRRHLAFVERVIVDEVHALAPNKRGAQLSLLLESLDELVAEKRRGSVASDPLCRIGLSATIAPLDRVARFLAGADRPCEIVDARGLRRVRLRVDAPFRGAVASIEQVARAAVRLSDDVRTTLVFTNVRSQAERLAHEIALGMGADGAADGASTGGGGGAVLAVDAAVGGAARTASEAAAARDRRIGVHHSALERSVRHRVEAQLRAGELRTVVCSSSLELGVDIGCVDRVLVVGGARGMTPTLQRVGRAGHRPDAVAEGVVIAQDRDDILEAAGTKRCIAAGVIEELEVPTAPLDVLAQWLVGSVCPDRRLPIDEALRIARRAFPYRELAEADLRACVGYLAGGGAGGDPAHVRRLGADADAIYGLGRDVCAAFFENVGTIPDEQHVLVRTAGARRGRGGEIGRVEESFAAALREGDVFLLNGRTLRVRELGPGGVSVEPYAGRPTVPTWSSHLKGIPSPLAAEIGRLRRELAAQLRAGRAAADRRPEQSAAAVAAARDWLIAECGIGAAEAELAARYVAQQMALSAVPDDRTPLIEIYRMDGRQTAIFHTCAGRRVNEVLARIVAARVVRLAGANAHLTCDDAGFLVAMPLGKQLTDDAWAGLLERGAFDRDLRDGLRGSALLPRFFRHVANAGLLVLRRAGGRSVRHGRLRWSSERIFEQLSRSDPEFPLVRETFRAVTHDLLDAPGARRYLERLAAPPRVLHPRAATPFSFGIVTSSFADAVVMEDRARMVEALHERVLAVLGASARDRDEARALERS